MSSVELYQLAWVANSAHKYLSTKCGAVAAWISSSYRLATFCFIAAVHRVKEGSHPLLAFPGFPGILLSIANVTCLLGTGQQQEKPGSHFGVSNKSYQ